MGNPTEETCCCLSGRNPTPNAHPVNHPNRSRKHVTNTGLQLLQNILQFAESDALLASFQPIQGGGGDAQLTGEHGVTGFTPPLA